MLYFFVIWSSNLVRSEQTNKSNVLQNKQKVLGNPLPYDDLTALRVRLAEISPTLIRYDSLETANFVSENLELLKVKF